MRRHPGPEHGSRASAVHQFGLRGPTRLISAWALIGGAAPGGVLANHRRSEAVQVSAAPESGPPTPVRAPPACPAMAAHAESLNSRVDRSAARPARRAYATWRRDETPVCVSRPGSDQRIVVCVPRSGPATAKALGYNRSPEGVHGARDDGFNATTRSHRGGDGAAGRDALVVLAVPMPVGTVDRVRRTGPDNPPDRRDQRQGAVRDAVADARDCCPLRRRAPYDGHRALRLGGRGRPVPRHALGHPSTRHVDATVWHQDEPRAGLRQRSWVRLLGRTHDAAAAAISHLPQSGRRDRWPRSPLRSVRRSRPGRRVVSGRDPGRRPPLTWCGRCARPTPTS